jgi:hypothetical protein
MTPALQTLVHGQIVDLDIQQTGTGFNVLHQGTPVATAMTLSEAKTKLVEYAEAHLVIVLPGEPLSFEPRTILIVVGSTRSARRSVLAMCCGPLAYHPPITGDGGYVITHIDSGMGFATATTEEQARQIVQTALASGIDWSQDVDALNALDGSAKQQRLMRQIQAITRA